MSSTQQAFPQLGTLFVTPDGRIGLAWYRLLITLWQRTGGSSAPGQGTVYLTQNGIGQILAYKSSDNSFIGVVSTASSTGGPAQVQALTTSPFTFVASLSGTMLVSSGQVEISRDGGSTYYTVSMQGGTIPLLPDDELRVSWTVGAPTVVFLPTVST